MLNPLEVTALIQSKTPDIEEEAIQSLRERIEQAQRNCEGYPVRVDMSGHRARYGEAPHYRARQVVLVELEEDGWSVSIKTLRGVFSDGGVYYGLVQCYALELMPTRRGK